MFAAQIQNLPPIEVKPKKRRRVGGGWPHEPTDFEDPFGLEAEEREAEVELGALVKEAQDEIAILADEMSVEVDDLDTEVVVESPHGTGSTSASSRLSFFYTDDGDD